MRGLHTALRSSAPSLNEVETSRRHHEQRRDPPCVPVGRAPVKGESVSEKVGAPKPAKDDNAGATAVTFSATSLTDSTDPQRLWRAGPHGKALPSLRHAIARGKQLALLTGDSGVGKTIGVNMLAQQLAEDGLTVVRIPVPLRDEIDLRAAIAYGLGGPAVTTREDLVAIAGSRGRLAIVVDDAQALTDAVLAELGAVLHEVPGSTAVLTGPDALAARIASAATVGPLASILPVARRLRSLGETETSLYVEHALEQAGARSDAIADETVRAIWRTSAGVPRIILHLCRRTLELGREPDRAQLKAWAQELDASPMEEHWPERPGVVVLPRDPAPPSARGARWLSGLTAAMIVVGAFAVVVSWHVARQVRVPSAAPHGDTASRPAGPREMPPPAPAVVEPKPVEATAPATVLTDAATPPSTAVEPVVVNGARPDDRAPARSLASAPPRRAEEPRPPLRRPPPAESPPVTPAESRLAPPAESRPTPPSESRARSAEPIRAADSSPDPGAVIDWLLKDSPRYRD